MKKIIIVIFLLLLAFTGTTQLSNVDSIKIRTSLTLQGIRVTGISKDTSPNRSNFNLITEKAVKDLIDAKIIVVDWTNGYPTYDLRYQLKGNYLLLTSLSASAPIVYSSATGVFSWAGSNVAISGNYNDLSNKPSSLPASDVYSWAKAASKPQYAYSELTGLPTLFDGTWNSLTGKPSTFTPSAHTHVKADITDFPTSLPASDVYAWAKASTKPTYTYSEVGAPSTTGTNASGTWGINITGNAGNSNSFGGMANSFSAGIRIAGINDMIGTYGDGTISRFNSSAVQSFLGLNNGSTLINNATSANSLNEVSNFPNANGQNFNDVQTGGFYNITIGNTTGILNAPDPKGYGTMEVQNGDNFVTQIFYSQSNSSVPYVRTMYKGTNSWDNWRQILTSGNYPNYALPLTGGTLTGNGNILTLNSSSNVYVKNISGSTFYDAAFTSNDGTNQVSSGLLASSGGTAGAWCVYNNGIRMTVLGNGNTGIGTKSPSYPLDVNGDARSFNSLDVANVKSYGAIGNGTTDDHVAIQNAFNTGKDVYFPDGIYNIGTSTITISNTCKVFGLGGHSFAYGSNSDLKGAVIKSTSSTANAFYVAVQGVKFQDINFLNLASSTPIGGAAIYFYTAENMTIDNCNFYRFYININVREGVWWNINHIKSLNAIHAGIYIEAPVTPDAGDWSISNSSFWSSNNSGYGVKMLASGGGKIVNCKFIELAVGFYAPIAYSTSQIQIANSSFENFSSYAIDVENSSSYFQCVQINNCQFNPGSSIAGLIRVYNTHLVNICNNIFMNNGNTSYWDIQLSNVITGVAKCNVHVQTNQICEYSCAGIATDYSTVSTCGN